MRAPTHIAGGIVFTGSLCSLYDINLFFSYQYVLCCVVCSVIPDIDNTRSWIGKMIYPIAKLINRRFGHRTITHSFLFVGFVWSFFYSLHYFNVIQDYNFTKIALFAVLSHIIIDMLTLAGVPFLYPFLKNSCVIPGNPNYRFETGDFKSEIVVTSICLGLCITMQPLFTNGFWTSYNRTFGTIKHVHRENNNTDFYTLCDYSYIDNQVTYEGTAIVIESQTNEITLFDNKRTFVLNSDDHKIKVNYSKPRPSSIPKLYIESNFFNITLDSLQTYLDNQISTGLIQSNYNVRYVDKAITYYTNFIQIKNKYDFRVLASTDTINNANLIKLVELEASQEEERRKHYIELSKYNNHISEIKDIENQLNNKNLNNYDRNKLQNNLIKLRQQRNEKPVFTNSLRLQAQIDELKNKMSERSLLFSGHLTTLITIDPSDEHIQEQYKEINEKNYVTQSSIFQKKQ